MENEVIKRSPKPKNLPPRLLRKQMEEKGGGHFIGTESEADWNGDTLTFQGSTNHYASNVHRHHQINYQNMHHPGGGGERSGGNQTYYSLPSRGRGRWRRDYDTMSTGTLSSIKCGRRQIFFKLLKLLGFNSLQIMDNTSVESPDSSQAFSSRTRSTDSLYRDDSRSQTPVQLLPDSRHQTPPPDTTTTRNRTNER